MELSKEQQLEKAKWTEAITKQYHLNIAEFSRAMVHDIPDDTRTILTAYAVDHESIFYWAMEEFLEARANALQKQMNQGQPTLFDYIEEEKNASDKV